MMASAMVASPRASCQWATGSWLVRQLSPVLDDLEQVRGLVGSQGPEHQVVDEQDVDPGPAGQQPHQAAVGTGRW